MKFIAIKTTILLFFLYLFTFTQAQKTWSLEECINYALENNISIKQSKLNHEMAKINQSQSKLNLLPGLNGGAGNDYNWGQRIDMFTNEFATQRTRSNQFSLSSSVQLFNGFRKQNEIKKANLEVKKSQSEYELLEDNISLQIAEIYLQTLFYAENIKNYTEQANLTKLQLQRTKKLFESGSIARGDVYMAESQLAAEEKLLTEAKNLHQMSLFSLSQLLEIPDNESFTIQYPEVNLENIQMMDKSVDEVLNRTLQNRAEIKIERKAIEIAELNTSIARSYYYPSLSLSGSLGTGYSTASKEAGEISFENRQIGTTQSGEPVWAQSPKVLSYKTVSFKDQLKNNVNKYVGLSLQIPIFNHLSVRNNVKTAKIGVQMAENNLLQRKNDLRKNVQKAYLDMQAALFSYQASVKKTKAFEQSYFYAEKKFELGMLNSLELNETKKNLSLAKSELLQAKYDYIFKRKVLDFYMGNSITL